MKKEVTLIVLPNQWNKSMELQHIKDTHEHTKAFHTCQTGATKERSDATPLQPVH